MCIRYYALHYFPSALDLISILYFTASKYEIRCYTDRDTLINEATFTEKGILVHDSFTPQPLDYGSKQSCTVGVPWPNEIFYYGLVAIDEAGNRSPISNIISVYIYEPPTTTTTTTTTTSVPLTVRNRGKSAVQPLYSEEVSVNERQFWGSKNVRVYIAIGVICAILFIAVGVILVIVYKCKTKRTTYDTENRDSYKAYEPQNGSGKNDKNLNSWLDSLPR